MLCFGRRPRRDARLDGREHSTKRFEKSSGSFVTTRFDFWPQFCFLRFYFFLTHSTQKRHSTMSFTGSPSTFHRSPSVQAKLKTVRSVTDCILLPSRIPFCVWIRSHANKMTWYDVLFTLSSSMRREATAGC